jgi:hypothetical protein
MGESGMEDVRHDFNLNAAMIAMMLAALYHPKRILKGASGPTVGALERRGLGIRLSLGRVMLTQKGIRVAQILAREAAELRRAEPVGKVRPLSVSRGSTIVAVTPPRPCGMGDCVAELHVSIRVDTMRVHLDEYARVSLIRALGGAVL